MRLGDTPGSLEVGFWQVLKSANGCFLLSHESLKGGRTFLDGVHRVTLWGRQRVVVFPGRHHVLDEVAANSASRSEQHEQIPVQVCGQSLVEVPLALGVASGGVEVK